uniref:RNA-dependent RNA polymerase n=1 Tax=Peterman partiti-like virus TaxID=2716669 RepID=A0A6G7PS14_9VIRU|nr:RNA-dependent RNA polymerase [Peterman partiti-like virus]
MGYAISDEVMRLRTYQYQNRRAKDTLKFLNSETGVIVEGSVKRALLEQGFLLNDQRDNKSHFEPQSSFDNLLKYAVYVPFNPDQEAWNKAYSATVHAFVLPMNQSIKQDMDPRSVFASVKGDKSSGAPEFSSKKDVSEKDYVRMLNWLRGCKAPDPCVAYHRVQHGSDGPRFRLVWGYPQSVTMGEGTFARPLIDMYKERRSVMAFGKTRHKLSAQMTSILNSHARYGLDMSRFDASIHASLINMAFNVLSKNFDWYESCYEDWQKIERYFIHTTILMPDGYVYTKHRGVPSGSYFTQMVDSVVNYFAIQYANFRLTGKLLNENKILVLGDDSIFGSDDAISIKEYARVLLELGLTVNQEKSCLALEHQQVEFLGHIWKSGLPDRNPIDVAKRMVYPENHSKITDGRVRIKTRVYPYVTDALSAHKIITEYQKCPNGIIPMYSNVDIDWKEGLTGWQELQTLNDNDLLINRDCLMQAYVGLLR